MFSRDKATDAPATAPVKEVELPARSAGTGCRHPDTRRAPMDHGTSAKNQRPAVRGLRGSARH